MGNFSSTLNATEFNNCTTQWASKNITGLTGDTVHLEEGSRLTAINSTIANSSTEICASGLNSIRNTRQELLPVLVNGEPVDIKEQLYLNNSQLISSLIGVGHFESSTVKDSILTATGSKNSFLDNVHSDFTIAENSTASDVSSKIFFISNSEAKNITAENILIENKGKGAVSVQDFNCPNDLLVQSNVAENIALSGKETESCTFELGITDAPPAAPTPSLTSAPTPAFTPSPISSSESTTAPSVSSATSSSTNTATLTALLATMAVINMMR